jgi:hypothetical protein
MGQRGRSGAREVVVIAQRERERERRSSGFSQMTPSGGGVAEMVTRRQRLEVGWVWWIMWVLSLRFLWGRRVAEGGRLRGGRQ